ncbi:hypothetical protein ACLMJK_003219 [Lecanora helva]
MPPKGRLLLTFDAFGTLFVPRESIAKSYADAARKYGLSGFSNDDIALQFRKSYKEQSKNAPNYGKKIGIAAPEWWSNDGRLFQVIHATFHPFNVSKALPKGLVPELLSRFSSSEGYMLYPDVLPMFRQLRQMMKNAEGNPNVSDLNVGIITNSDDRVISILSTLGLSIGPLRYGRNPYSNQTGVHFRSSSGKRPDIDFVTISYDVGFEKPAHQIFDAAKQLGRFGPASGRLIHVGDDPDKDISGAQHAGWEGILLDRQENSNKPDLAHCSAVIPNLLELESLIIRSST